MRDFALLPTKTRNAYEIVVRDMESRRRDLVIQLAKVNSELEAHDRIVRLEEAIIKIALGASPEDAVKIAREALNAKPATEKPIISAITSIDQKSATA